MLSSGALAPDDGVEASSGLVAGETVVPSLLPLTLALPAAIADTLALLGVGRVVLGEIHVQIRELVGLFVFFDGNEDGVELLLAPPLQIGGVDAVGLVVRHQIVGRDRCPFLVVDRVFTLVILSEEGLARGRQLFLLIRFIERDDRDEDVARHPVVLQGPDAREVLRDEDIFQGDVLGRPPANAVERLLVGFVFDEDHRRDDVAPLLDRFVDLIAEIGVLDCRHEDGEVEAVADVHGEQLVTFVVAGEGGEEHGVLLGAGLRMTE